MEGQYWLGKPLGEELSRLHGQYRQHPLHYG